MANKSFLPLVIGTTAVLIVTYVLFGLLTTDNTNDGSSDDGDKTNNGDGNDGNNRDASGRKKQRGRGESDDTVKVANSTKSQGAREDEHAAIDQDDDALLSTEAVDAAGVDINDDEEDESSDDNEDNTDAIEAALIEGTMNTLDVETALYDAGVDITDNLDDDDDEEAAPRTTTRSNGSSKEADEQKQIQTQAARNAASIINALPQIPLVQECIAEVESGVLDRNAALEELVGVVGGVDDVEGEREGEDDADGGEVGGEGAGIDIIPEEDGVNEEEHSLPLPAEKQSATAVVTPSKTTPRTSLSTKPSYTKQQQDEITTQPPTDTTDYSLLSSYWKQQSDKNSFASPIKDIGGVAIKSSGAAKEIADVVVGMNEEGGDDVHEEEKCKPPSAVTEESIAVPATEMEPTQEKDLQKSEEHDTSANEADASAGNANADEASSLPDTEQGKEDNETQLIIPGDSKDDSLNEEGYVKIVCDASGDPMSDSELLLRPVVSEVAGEEGKGDAASVEKDEEAKESNVEEAKKTTATSETNAGEATAADSSASNTGDVSKGNAGSEGVAVKKKSNRKKKGKKKSGKKK